MQFSLQTRSVAVDSLMQRLPTISSNRRWTVLILGRPYGIKICTAFYMLYLFGVLQCSIASVYLLEVSPQFQINIHFFLTVTGMECDVSAQPFEDITLLSLISTIFYNNIYVYFFQYKRP